MITPVNGHLLIEPLAHDSFIASAKDTYEEIGTIVAYDPDFDIASVKPFSIGDKVFFDAWLAARYPKEGTDSQFYWLVKYEDVRALEHVESKSV